MHDSLLQLRRGGWYFRILRRMDPGHRLVLRWCMYLAFEDVLCIDRRWLVAHELRSGPSLRWRLMLGNDKLPKTWAPCTLVEETEWYAIERAEATWPHPEGNTPVFDQAGGEPITHASLRAALRDALLLVDREADYAMRGDPSPLTMDWAGDFSVRA